MAINLLPHSVLGGDIMTFIIIAVLLFLVELVFYLIPGVSLSSLLIGMTAIAFGFVPVFVISLFAILAAHFVLRKDISLFMPDIFTLVPMVAFATFLGAGTIDMFGWGIYGALLGLVKWGAAILTGFMFGRNMAKRYMEVLLEPVLNFFIFTYLTFVFAWLV
ncbi:MAG: hypothetical protein ABIG20_03290 [archaeon]